MKNKKEGKKNTNQNIETEGIRSVIGQDSKWKNTNF